MDNEYREDAQVITLSDTVPWFYVELLHPVMNPLITLLTTNTKRINVDAKKLEMWIGSKSAGNDGDPWTTILPSDAIKCGILSGGGNQYNVWTNTCVGTGQGFYLRAVDDVLPLLDKYGRTFLATGCSRRFATHSYWKSLEDSTAWNDMFSYCSLTKDGSATEGQRNICCGSTTCTPPTSCVKQTAWRQPWDSIVMTELRVAVVRTLSFGAWCIPTSSSPDSSTKSVTWHVALAAKVEQDVQHQGDSFDSSLSTIQHAISRAVDGDIILLGAGEYKTTSASSCSLNLLQDPSFEKLIDWEMPNAQRVSSGVHSGSYAASASYGPNEPHTLVKYKHPLKLVPGAEYMLSGFFKVSSVTKYTQKFGADNGIETASEFISNGWTVDVIAHIFKSLK